MKKSLKIGIAGVGWVGSQLKRYFEELKGYERGKDLFLLDKDPAKNFFDDVNQADVVFIAVPTPANPQDGSCDFSIVESVLGKFGSGKTAVIKSTVPPGATEYFQKRYPALQILFSPEFLTESRAWEETIKPDRQFVGYTEVSFDTAPAILEILPKAPFQLVVKAVEAELIKYASNVYLARRVNWANALAKSAEKLGADYEKVRQGLAADHRIGPSHLDVNHGGYRGFGGYCLPKDVSAFMSFAKQNGLEDIYNLLAADWKFNEDLLKEQGLTVEDVSKHIDNI